MESSQKSGLIKSRNQGAGNQFRPDNRSDGYPAKEAAAFHYRYRQLRITFDRTGNVRPWTRLVSEQYAHGATTAERSKPGSRHDTLNTT